MVDEEGTSFEGAFGALFGAQTNTQDRLKAERRAGMTAKQRDRKKIKNRDVQINVRATKAVKALLDRITSQLGGSAADHFEAALVAYAKANKIEAGEK